MLTLRDSSDITISRAWIEVRTSRRWSASSAVEKAESRLPDQDIVGISCSGRQGLENNTSHHGILPLQANAERLSRVRSGERTKKVQESEGGLYGEPGKLDKVADTRKETKLDKHLEIPVLPSPISDQGVI